MSSGVAAPEAIGAQTSDAEQNISAADTNSSEGNDIPAAREERLFPVLVDLSLIHI